MSGSSRHIQHFMQSRPGAGVPDWIWRCPHDDGGEICAYVRINPQGAVPLYSLMYAGRGWFVICDAETQKLTEGARSLRNTARIA